MGRGRAKAKQTKVARELKYSSPSTNFSHLQRELSGSGGAPGFTRARELPNDDAYKDDPYAKWNDDEDDD